MVEDTVDVGLLFGGINGGGASTVFNVFEGDDDPANPFTPSFEGDWGLGISPNTKQNFRIEIESENFAAADATGTLNVYVTHPTFGERQVLSDFLFDWDADGEAFIGFSSNKDQGSPADISREVQIDNLVISTFIPEPATLGLIGLAALGLAFQRR
ncbi:MAG: PEP-CTERM sorting domain-containing protein [Planctomycetota bacterium]